MTIVQGMIFTITLLGLIVSIVIVVLQDDETPANTENTTTTVWPIESKQSLQLLSRGTHPVKRLHDAKIVHTKVCWHDGRVLNFSLPRRSNVLRDGGRGFVGVSIAQVPAFDGAHNVVRLESPLHELDVVLMEADGERASILAHRGDDAGVVLKEDTTLANLGDDDWMHAFNGLVRDVPVSFMALIYREEEEDRDCVVTGYSLSNWMPRTMPSVDEFLSQCDFVKKSNDVVVSPRGYRLIVASNAAGDPPPNDVACWDIRKIVVLADASSCTAQAP